MGQRLSRQEQQQRTREALLDAAELVFSAAGFNGASLDDVAAAAGFSKGAVYSNFASKDELFLVLIDRQMRRLTELWDQALVTGGAGSPQLDPAQVFAGEVGSSRTRTMLALEFFLYALRNPQAMPLLAQRYQLARQHIRASLHRPEGATVDVAFADDDLAWLILGLTIGLDMQVLAAADQASVAASQRVMTALLKQRTQL